jgi:hypothetical protein
MNPLAGLFKHGPDALRLSDWLQNMNEAFLKLGGETLFRDKSSPDMLAYFTLVSTTHSADHILHNIPAIASRIGTVYGELRAYYECLWYLHLLTKYESHEDRDKVSKLYASVSLRFEQILNSLFAQNPNIKRCLESASGEPYVRRFYAAFKEYLHGERKNSRHNTGDLLTDNVHALSLTIQRAAGLRETERESVVRIMSKDTEDAFHLNSLTQFDYRNCKCLDLPDFFYR